MTARTETSFRLPVPLNALKNIVVFLLKSPTSAFGLAVLLLLVIAAIFAPWLATHDPYAQDLANTLKAPGNGHVFGTDELGRDIYSRLLWGARITLTIISLVSIIVGPVGLLVGTASGYLGGKFDTVMMRITDIFLSFPSLILSLAFVAALGPSLNNAIIAIALTSWPPIARLARAEIGSKIPCSAKPYTRNTCVRAIDIRGFATAERRVRSCRIRNKRHITRCKVEYTVANSR